MDKQRSTKPPTVATAPSILQTGPTTLLSSEHRDGWFMASYHCESVTPEGRESLPQCPACRDMMSHTGGCVIWNRMLLEARWKGHENLLNMHDAAKHTLVMSLSTFCAMPGSFDLRAS